MQLHDEFEVPASVDVVWAYVLNVEQIAPCMPGAELTEVVDDHTWKGKVTVKVGPVSMAFAGTVVIQERDDASKRIVLKADGRDQRGKGAANAMVTAQLTASGSGAKVTIDTELTITGAAAQYARGGMIQDISSRLTGQFADCLASNLNASDAPPPVAGDPAPPVAAAAAAATPAPPAAAESGTPSPPAGGSSPGPARPLQSAKPVGGGRLAVWAIWRAIVRFFKGIFGRGR
jgi:carbon monoxide dehydrogenase subunit G